MTDTRKSRKTRQAGFSLIELTISILILVIIMGAIFKQIDNIQKQTKTESMKLDLTQENRDFVDRFARDIHMAGYPISDIYQNSAGPNDPTIAMGLVEATPTYLRFEGDVYGDGTVYSVEYKYYQSDVNDPNCPCLRRSVQPKQPADPLKVDATAVGGTLGQLPPLYYTEVQNVIDPAGMSQGLFTYFEANGNVVNVGTGIGYDALGQTGVSDPATLQKIDAIKVNLNTRSAQVDLQTGQNVVNSISTIAELEN
ncbi:MAG: type II secretion system protein J [Terriglobales bacterium]|jgi:prepilin-type N-terminal cleavage/methylation domain-containing protein